MVVLRLTLVQPVSVESGCGDPGAAMELGEDQESCSALPLVARVADIHLCSIPYPGTSPIGAEISYLKKAAWMEKGNP